jgi:hypothetical protein
MPKSSLHNEFLPPQVIQSLSTLGEGLALARLRRKESLRSWALRMGVAVRTVQRMEKGDPGVGMGVYAMGIWLMGRSQALADVAAPEFDRGALTQEIRALQRKNI